MAFDYHGTQMYHTFDQFATFCTTDLETFEQEHHLPSIAFCYHIDNTVDGMAGHSFGFPYIFLYRGIIDIMNQFFINHETAFIYPEFNEFRAMRQQLSLPLGYLLFQLTSLFAYYHERSHIQQMKGEIMQWADGGEDTRNLMEGYALDARHAEYDRLGHAMEFDADVRAAQLCAEHVLQFQNGSNQRIQLMASLGVAGVLVYWLYLCHGEYELYFKQGRHPHPLIRSFYVADAMMRQLNILSGAAFNSELVLNSALRIVDAIYEHQENHPIQAFFNALEENGDEIEEFVNDLIEICNDYPNLIRNQQ